MFIILPFQLWKIIMPLHFLRIFLKQNLSKSRRNRKWRRTGNLLIKWQFLLWVRRNTGTITGGMRKEKAESRPRQDLYGYVYLCVFLRVKLCGFFFFFTTFLYHKHQLGNVWTEWNGKSKRSQRKRDHGNSWLLLPIWCHDKFKSYFSFNLNRSYWFCPLIFEIGVRLIVLYFPQFSKVKEFTTKPHTPAFWKAPSKLLIFHIRAYFMS